MASNPALQFWAIETLDEESEETELVAVPVNLVSKIMIIWIKKYLKIIIFSVIFFVFVLHSQKKYHKTWFLSEWFFENVALKNGAPSLIIGQMSYEVSCLNSHGGCR